jgi:hypothetical protein
MTRAVKLQKYQAILTLLSELLEEKDIENGARTIIVEVMQMIRGRVKGLNG